MKAILRIIHKLTTRNPKLILTLCVVLTLVLGFMARDLSLEMTWSGLVPKEAEAFKTYEEIIDGFPSMGSIMVMAETNGDSNLEAAVEEAIAELQTNEYVESVYSKIPSDFLLEYSTKLAEPEMVDMISGYFMDKNMDGYFTSMNTIMTYLEEAEEEISETELRGILKGLDNGSLTLSNIIEEGNSNYDLSQLIVGDTYTRSIDGNKIMITIQPNFAMMDYEKLLPGVNSILDALEEIESKHTGIEFKTTGMHVVAKDEMESTEKDTALTMMIGIIGIVILMLVAFKMKSAPILAVTPLLIAIAWTAGITGIVIGRLNLMTVFTAIMLIGLGVDFSIHMMSAYTEKMSEGYTMIDALEYAVVDIGSGIFSGALTTAVAFYTLSVGSLELLKELGFVMGTGLLMTVIAVFFMLPSMVTLIYKNRPMKKIKARYELVGSIAVASRKNYIAVLLVIVVGFGIFGYLGFQNEMTMNILELEPKGLESVENMTELTEDFGMSSDGLMLLVDSLEEVRTTTEELNSNPLVSKVVSINDMMKDETHQQLNVDRLKELESYLEFSVPEMPVDKTATLESIDLLITSLSKLGYPEYTIGLSELRTSIGASSDTELNNLNHIFYSQLAGMQDLVFSEELLTVDKLPTNIKSQMVTTDGTKFLMSVYPTFDMWEEIGSDLGVQFFDEMREINEDFTGTPLFMRILFESASKEMVKTLVFVFIGLLTILLLHFRSLKDALFIFIPLIFTLGFTIGTMELVGLKWNMLNVLSVPLIIGIGIDNGIHIMNSVRLNPQSTRDIFATVGRAILITTMTTMIGFGSLMFSSYRGIAYFGAVIFIGVAFAFLMTVLVIPVLLRLFDKNYKTEVNDSKSLETETN